MSRVFPIDEWRTEWREAQDSNGPSTNDLNASSSLRHLIANPIKSTPASDESTISETFHNLSLGPLEEMTQDNGKKEKGLRGMFRRASVSLKSKRQRLYSTPHSMAERPTTSSSAWGKLRKSASFSRHSRLFGSQTFDDADTPFDSYECFRAPIPGNGSEPPIIPIGSGGSAARATAAAQNEYFVRQRAQYLAAKDQQGDHESGIGITISPLSEVVEYANLDSLVCVDFITRLPNELSQQILAYLDSNQLYNVMRVSHTWRAKSSAQYIWRQAYSREKLKAYALPGNRIPPGMGLGVPAMHPDHDWKDLYRITNSLEANWKQPQVEPVYLSGHLDSIYCVQFDEHKVITGSRDRTIRIWDLHTYTCKLVIGPPRIKEDPNILVGRDGQPQHYALLADSTKKGVCMPPVVSFPIHHDASILCLQYDEKILVTGSSDSSAIVYDIANKYRPVRKLLYHTAAVLDLAFDDRYIVTCSKDASICLWDRSTGDMVKQLRGHGGPVNAVQLRGNTIVSCGGDFTVKMWNVDTGKTFRELNGHTKGLACSQFSQDSRYIASAGNDKIIRIWDANTGECLHEITAHEQLVRSLHIDSVSGRLISGSYDQDVKVFDMETGIPLLDFPAWHWSWVLGAKSDYRRIISTGQFPKILVIDFGMHIDGIDKLQSGGPIGLEGLGDCD